MCRSKRSNSVKKCASGKMAVDDADRIVRIKGHLQVAADGLDRLHVARRNVTGGADQGKARHLASSLMPDFRQKLPHSG